jgi:hypothetical protein
MPSFIHKCCPDGVDGVVDGDVHGVLRDAADLFVGNLTLVVGNDDAAAC